MNDENSGRYVSVKSVDMFGRTVTATDIQMDVSSHVETCVLLSKLKSTPHIEVEINLDEMDLSRAESKATYEEIKEYVLKNYGMNVTNLYIAQLVVLIRFKFIETS